MYACIHVSMDNHTPKQHQLVKTIKKLLEFIVPRAPLDPRESAVDRWTSLKVINTQTITFNACLFDCL